MIVGGSGIAALLATPPLKKLMEMWSSLVTCYWLICYGQTLRIFGNPEGLEYFIC
jgi:hypothetical protein